MKDLEGRTAQSSAQGAPQGAKKSGVGCEEFQESLPELFESRRAIESEEHLKTCEQCASLVRDLRYIADQAKLLLPLHDPSPAVWDKIEAKLHE